MFVAVQSDEITFRSCCRSKVEKHIEEHGGLLYELLYCEPDEIVVQSLRTTESLAEDSI